MKNYSYIKKAAVLAVAALGFSSLMFANLASADLVVSGNPGLGSCVPLSHSLYPGVTDYSTGGEVTTLQTYLGAQGYMSHAPTGYYGALTAQAVAKFQSAHGITPLGIVGPLTRTVIAQNCTITVPPSGPVSIYTLTPMQGPVGTTVTLTGFGFTSDNTITFGGMPLAQHVQATGGVAIACTTDPSCIPGIRQSVSFVVPSSIGPICTSGMQCPMYATRLITPGVYQVSVSNAGGTSNPTSFTVTDGSTSNTLSVIGVSPSAAPIGSTISITGTGFLPSGNSVLFNDGAINNVSAVSNGNGTQTMTVVLPSYTGIYCAPGMMCSMLARQLTPGNYALMVKNANGSSNGVSFTITSTGTDSGPLFISGIDAPASLPFNTQGTWTVHASSQSGGTLHYAVVWGDENVYPGAATSMAPQNTYQTTATFTHSYATTGTYTPTFTVTDDFGHSAQTSATVTITPYY